MALKRTIFYQIKAESVEINHKSSWPYVLDQNYRSLNIGDSGSGKTDVLMNVMKY